jgi:hypothetical protein
LLKTTSPPPSGDARLNLLYGAKPKNRTGNGQLVLRGIAKPLA